MSALRHELPADDGWNRAHPAADPGVYEQARGIDFEVFALDAEGFAVDADAVAGPFAADAKVGFPFFNAVHVACAPPLRHLVRVSDGLEDAGRRRGDENFTGDDILIGSDCDGCHECLLSF